MARFDIGFIGPGNSEISKDKLSRFARQVELTGSKHDSTTFIIVDRLPQTGKTEQAAKSIDAEIIQMSMQFWPKLLAQRIGERLGYEHELQHTPDQQVGAYLERRLAAAPIQDFLAGVSVAELTTATDNETPA